MSLPNPFPELRLRHPHRRRLPRHARHIVQQMLRPRVAMRAGTLQVHARQLDSAVNLGDYPDRVHPDSDRHAPGVRVAVGPEARSLLRQLLDSRDMRVQQQLVREVIHHLQKRVLAALRRAARLEKARELAARAAQAAARAPGAAWGWLVGRSHWVCDKAAGRTVRVVGGRKRARAGSRVEIPFLRRRATPASRARKPAAARRPAGAPSRTERKRGEAPARTERKPATRTRPSRPRTAGG